MISESAVASGRAERVVGRDGRDEGVGMGAVLDVDCAVESQLGSVGSGARGGTDGEAWLLDLGVLSRWWWWTRGRGGEGRKGKAERNQFIAPAMHLGIVGLGGGRWRGRVPPRTAAVDFDARSASEPQGHTTGFGGAMQICSLTTDRTSPVGVQLLQRRRPRAAVPVVKQPRRRPQGPGLCASTPPPPTAIPACRPVRCSC